MKKPQDISKELALLLQAQKTSAINENHASAIKVITAFTPEEEP